MLTVEAYEQAERELLAREWRRGWAIHATVFTIVMSGLIALNVLLVVLTAASFFWFPFPLAGWGIGLAMHYLHGVRWADREISARQAKVERRVERLTVGLGPG